MATAQLKLSYVAIICHICITSHMLGGMRSDHRVNHDAAPLGHGGEVEGLAKGPNGASLLVLGLKP